MATPNVGILTNAGKDLIDRVNAGRAKITFTKIVFSSMDNSQLNDDKIRALTTVAPQEVVVNNPEVNLDNSTGETRIRATGTNEKLDDGVYVKTYGVFAKDDTGNEILYGLTVSPNPNYFPAYDGVTPQVVTYSYKVIISNTSNITFTNSNDIYLSENDLGESLKPYAKIVYVNQQLNKKVNVADMRKPASDVAGIEEVNAKQDKIGYTPADDSKVIHHTIPKSVRDMNDEISDGLFYDTSLETLHSPFSSSSFYYQVFAGASGNIRQVAYANLDAFNPATRSSSNNGSTWTNWNFETIVDDDGLMTYGPSNWQIKVADDSKVVHKTGTEEIGGQKTYDIAPIDKTTGKPYITKDGVPNLPPDIARTGKAQTFTVAQTFSIAPTITDASRDKEDNQAAVMADLKRVENSAWHMMSGSSEALKTYNCWFKINKDKKRLEIIVLGVTNKMSYSDTRVTNEMGYFDTRVTNKMGYFDTYTILDLSNIITNISRFSGYFNIFGSGASGPESSDVSYSILTDGARAKVSNVAAGSNLAAQIISDEVYSDSGTGNPAYVYYDDLQDAYK